MRFTKNNTISKTSFLLLCASFDSLAPARLMRRFSQPASPSELPVGSLSRPSPRSRFALRANLRLLYLVLTLALGCGQVSASDDPFSKLADDLGKESSGEKVNIAVGSFNYENTDLQSPFSSMLRDELEIALGETGKFKVVTRDRLADLQNEGKFQGKGILEPGTGVEKVSIEGVKGIIRGRFYAKGDDVTVYAELAWLEGGEVKKARLAIPTSKVRAKIWPDAAEAASKSLDGAIKPQNVEQSLANVQEIAKDRLAKIPKDFQVEIFTVDGKRAYAEKENISFRVRSTEECHIAVLCHQSDGTSVVLFPNRFCSNTQIPANKAIDIPGTHKSGFEIEIGPPFGSDVVEVIACSKATELHKQFSQFAAKATDEQPFQTLTRGMAVKATDTALSSSKNGDASPLKWGQDSIVVSTFPKP